MCAKERIRLSKKRVGRWFPVISIIGRPAARVSFALDPSPVVSQTGRTQTKGLPFLQLMSPL